MFKRQGAIQTKSQVDLFIGFAKQQIATLLLPHIFGDRHAIYLLYMGSNSYIGRTAFQRTTQQRHSGPLLLTETTRYLSLNVVAVTS